MKKILLFLLLVGLLRPVTSFGQFIDTVFVRSSNVPGNNMELIAKVWLQSQPAWNINLISRISNDTIYLTSCYVEGPLATPKLVTDTFQFGSLSPGIHTLHFKALKTYDQTHQNHSQCFSYWPNIAILNFAVAAPSGIKSEQINAAPSFYPNPVNDILTIASRPLQQITLRDLSGRIIQSKNYQGETSIKLNVATLPKGIYLLEVIDEKGIRRQGKLIKN